MTSETLRAATSPLRESRSETRRLGRGRESSWTTRLRYSLLLLSWSSSRGFIELLRYPVGLPPSLRHFRERSLLPAPSSANLTPASDVVSSQSCEDVLETFKMMCCRITCHLQFNRESQTERTTELRGGGVFPVRVGSQELGDEVRCPAWNLF